MRHCQLFLRSALLVALGVIALASTQARAATAAEINASAQAALRTLCASDAKARFLSRHAFAILVFPSITKGGFIVAAQHGEGALFTDRGTVGYFRSVAASYGFQAGIQKFGYALFFMNRQSLDMLFRKEGWELGSAPSLVVVDKGVSASLSTTNLDKGVYAFFFDQRGLMGGLSLQGSKITQIHPR